MGEEHVNGWCCADCLMLLANGETDPGWSEGETTAYMARVDAMCDDTGVTLGRMFGEDGCEHTREDWDADPEPHAEECERLTFSWSRCDVCGSTLGGERAAVTFWLRGEKGDVR